MWSYAYPHVCVYLPALSVSILLRGRFFGFLISRGDTLHRSTWNLAWQKSTPHCQISPWSAQKCWIYGPKNFENFQFYQYNALKGRIPCAVQGSYKIYNLCASYPNNSAKFGCFSSINNRAINSSQRLDNFSKIFDGLWRLNCWWDPKKLRVQWWHGGPPSSFMPGLVKIERHNVMLLYVRGQSVMFSLSLFLFVCYTSPVKPLLQLQYKKQHATCK